MSTLSKTDDQLSVRNLIQEIALLSTSLPDTVRLGHHCDKLCTVINGEKHDEGEWINFNKQLDAVFAKDCSRNGESRFHHLRHGLQGMALVAQCLQSLGPDKLSVMPAD